MKCKSSIAESHRGLEKFQPSMTKWFQRCLVCEQSYADGTTVAMLGHLSTNLGHVPGNAGQGGLAWNSSVFLDGAFGSAKRMTKLFDIGDRCEACQ